jgi:hypothetical protein
MIRLRERRGFDELVLYIYIYIYIYLLWHFINLQNELGLAFIYLLTRLMIENPSLSVIATGGNIASDY